METYTDFVLDTGAEVSTVAKATSRILSLALENSGQVLSGADGFPLSVLGKSEVFLENKLKLAKMTVYVIKGLQCNLLRISELKKLVLLAVKFSVCKIEDVSIPSSVTTGELTTDCKGYASAPAPSVLATTCSSMTNGRDINSHKYQCLTVPVAVEKVENRKGLDDPYCNFMVPSKRGVTRTLTKGLQKGLTLVYSTFGVNNVHIMSVGVKHVDISNNSCEVKTGTSVGVESGCMEVEGGEGVSSSADPCSTIVGGTTGSVSAGTVGAGGNRPLDIGDRIS